MLWLIFRRKSIHFLSITWNETGLFFCYHFLCETIFPDIMGTCEGNQKLAIRHFSTTKEERAKCRRKIGGERMGSSASVKFFSYMSRTARLAYLHCLFRFTYWHNLTIQLWWKRRDSLHDLIIRCRRQMPEGENRNREQCHINTVILPNQLISVQEYSMHKKRFFALLIIRSFTHCTE